MHATAKPLRAETRARIVKEAKARWAKAAKARQPREVIADLQSNIGQLDELMRRAFHAAGCKDEAAFKRLPREEQNAFLAQARGEASDPNRGTGELVKLDPAAGNVRRSPFNRDDFDEEEMAKLIADVKVRGVIQPGIVRRVNPPQGKIEWEIIAGERRWIAATAAKVLWPATVRDVDDTEAIELQAIENFQREDLNPMDEAQKYAQLRECYTRDGLTATAAVERIAEKLKRKTSAIYGLLTLTTKLVSNVQVLVRSGVLPKSHAELLTKIGNMNTQMTLASKMLKAADHERGDDGRLMSFRNAKHLVEEAANREQAARAFAVKAKEIEKVEGSQVFVGKAAEKIRNGYEYVELTCRAQEFCPNWKDEKTWEKMVRPKQLPPPVLVEDYAGDPVVMYPRETMISLAQANGHKLAKDGTDCGGSEAAVQAAHRLRVKAFEALLGPVAAAAERLDGPEFLRFVFAGVVGEFRDSAKRVVKRRALPLAKDKNACDALRTLIGDDANGRELRGMIAELLFARFAPASYSSGWDDGMGAACKLFGVDLPPWSAVKLKAAGKVRASGKAGK